MFFVLLLCLQSYHSYNLTSCVSSESRFTPSDIALVGSVRDCENTCSLSNSTMFLIQLSECSCYKNISELLNERNPSECSHNCSDGLPCGASQRYSQYSMDPIRKDINLTDPQGTTISVGTGDGQDVRKTIRIAIITLGVIGGLLFFGIIFWCVRKRNSRRKHPQIDEASLNADIKYLVRDLLPVAPTGLYSVISNYDSQRPDELSLKVDQVVAIKEAYSDKWAKGTNITTGKQGFFPLAVLISDEKYLKKGIQISERVKSLKASSKFSDRLF